MSSTISRYAGLIVAAAGAISLGLAGCSSYNISDDVARTARDIMRENDLDKDGYLTSEQIEELRSREPNTGFTYRYEALAVIEQAQNKGQDVSKAITKYQQDWNKSKRDGGCSIYAPVGDRTPGGVQ